MTGMDLRTAYDLVLADIAKKKADMMGMFDFLTTAITNNAPEVAGKAPAPTPVPVPVPDPEPEPDQTLVNEPQAEKENTSTILEEAIKNLDAATRTEIQALTLEEAIVRVIIIHGRPMRAAEIQEALSDIGRDHPIGSIYAICSKTNKLRKIGPGLWGVK